MLTVASRDVNKLLFKLPLSRQESFFLCVPVTGEAAGRVNDTIDDNTTPPPHPPPPLE